MMIDQWARRWRVPPAAMKELHSVLCPDVDTGGRLPESAVQAEVRLEASKAGVRLWRNNVGALRAEDGRMVRYGLANDSKELNGRIKSSDLIGIRPLLIDAGMVGCTIGQFVAREVKHGGWCYRGSERERAQLAFLQLVASLGGDACFAAGRGTL